MNETFNPVIANGDDFNSAVETLGAKLAEIARLEAEAAPCKDLVKAYAQTHKIRVHKTANFKLKLVRSKPVLKVQKDVRRDDVVSLMRKDPIGKTFLVTSYDTDAIKEALDVKAIGEDQLEAFGLQLLPGRESVSIEPRH